MLRKASGQYAHTYCEVYDNSRTWAMGKHCKYDCNGLCLFRWRNMPIQFNLFKSSTLNIGDRDFSQYTSQSNMNICYFQLPGIIHQHFFLAFKSKLKCCHVLLSGFPLSEPAVKELEANQFDRADDTSIAVNVTVYWQRYLIKKK